jgi:DNA polymerase III subunit delta'
MIQCHGMSGTNADFQPSGWPVYGHAWAIHFLQRTLQTAVGGLRHAYLFLGPPQVGKSTLARAFVQGLFCEQSAERPCGVCRACQLLQHGNHPDFRVIQSTDKPLDKDWAVDRANGTLRAEQAAEIIREAALRPVEARYKVFFIQDFHNAHPTFANKLLKTLEEPPDHVILLLSAWDRESILPTIVSRCQVLELRPLTVAEVENALVEKWKAPADQAALLARLANGCLGWAVQQLSDREGAGRRQEQLAQLRQLVQASRVERLHFVEKMATDRNNEQLFAMLGLWTTWWRDVLLAQVGCPEACCNVDQQEEISRHAAGLESAAVRDYLHTIQRIEGYLHHTVNTRMALDVLLLRLPQMS